MGMQSMNGMGPYGSSSMMMGPSQRELVLLCSSCTVSIDAKAGSMILVCHALCIAPVDAKA